MRRDNEVIEARGFKRFPARLDRRVRTACGAIGTLILAFLFFFVWCDANRVLSFREIRIQVATVVGRHELPVIQHLFHVAMKSRVTDFWIGFLREALLDRGGGRISFASQVAPASGHCGNGVDCQLRFKMRESAARLWNDRGWKRFVFAERVYRCTLQGRRCRSLLCSTVLVSSSR